MTFAEKNWGDCSSAVAYELNFVQQCECYSDETYYDYFAEDCKCGLKTHQIKDLSFPKGKFSKKDYYQLDIEGFGVSEKLKNSMISFGIDENVFRPVSTKSEIILGYQLVPYVILPYIYDQNDTRAIFICPECGERRFEVMYYGGDYDDKYDQRAYKGVGYPTYIPNDVLEIIDKEKVVRTKEFNDIIISLDLYNYLIKLYPRLECRPVFLGDLKDDKEYKRVRKEGEAYRVLYRDLSMGNISYFTDFITVQEENPEIKMIVYSVDSFDGIKCNFYENINGEYRCITSESFSIEDIKDGFYSEPEEILCVENCRRNVNKVLGGFITARCNDTMLNENIPINIIDLKYGNKKYKFWYAVLKR